VIRGFDITTASDAALNWIYELRHDCHREVAPAEPFDPRSVVVRGMRHAPASEQRWFWLAGDPPVGYGALSVQRGSSSGFVRLLVEPSHRRRGVGRSLLAAIQEQAAAVGCHALFTMHGGGDGAAFCAALGIPDGGRTVKSLLTMTNAPVAKPVDGYSIRSWQGAAPDGLVASYAQARQAINDALAEIGAEAEAWSVTRVRDVERTWAERDVALRITAAVDGDAVVAFTEIVVAAEPGCIANTNDTAVLPDHRRRGLATWVTSESLRLLVQDRADVTAVHTANAETNFAMLAVNRRLGFRPVATWTRVTVPVGTGD
jgi:GNAT superfamily N-acetyltransferase